MEQAVETYTTILRELFTHHEDRDREMQAEVCTRVKRQALDLCRVADERVAERFDDAAEDRILTACEPIHDMTLHVIERQHYGNCLRAGFFSVYVSEGQRVSRLGLNHCHPVVPLDCMLGTRGKDGTCIRELSKRSGDYYGNCPSLHAAEWLHLPHDINPEKVLWIEGGATLERLEEGKMYVGTSKSHLVGNATGRISGRLYRCTMCLKHALGQGIMEFAFLNHSDQPSLFFGSVPDHLAAMTVCNTADDLLASSLQV